MLNYDCEYKSITDIVNPEAFICLCRDINMPDVVVQQLVKNFNDFDFVPISDAFKKLFKIETGEEGTNFIKEYCKNEQDGLLSLTVYLAAAVITRENYRKLGISDSIYIDTMKIFTRFVNEHLVSYGKYGFDRGWWIYRNLSCSLFRLGELEFEMCVLSQDEGESGAIKKGDSAISVHIPSDAKLTRYETERSYEMAEEFFEKYFNDFKYKFIFCKSWLLAPILWELLPTTSKILDFQDDFEIVYYNTEDNSFMEWVYKRNYDDYNKLTENTSLERGIKKHLLRGGKIGCAFGLLKSIRSKEALRNC